MESTSKDVRIAELHSRNAGLRNEVARLQAENDFLTTTQNDLIEACQRLLKFNEELCQDVNVSTHYPSAELARQLIAKLSGENV